MIGQSSKIVISNTRASLDRIDVSVLDFDFYGRTPANFGGYENSFEKRSFFIALGSCEGRSKTGRPAVHKVGSD